MPLPSLKPFWTTSDGVTAKLWQGNVTDVLARLPAGSVHCVVTSPPYWGLRNYNVGEMELGAERKPDCSIGGQLFCGECHVCRMRGVFRAVRRVLRDDGVCWLNYGDSYNANVGGKVREGMENTKGGTGGPVPNAWGGRPSTSIGDSGLKPGNLVGVPWRVALALQADGWVLRQDVIWHKPAPMPESVRNRCTKAHEYVFLLTKGVRYFYDAEAIKTDAEPAERVISGKSGSYGQAVAAGVKPSGNGVPGSVMRTGNKSNKRSVWSEDDHRGLIDWLAENDPTALTRFLADADNRGDVLRISSQGYEGAHFATFPPKLIEPMILAGTSAKGACAKCGAPWRRVTEERALRRDRPNEYVKRTGEEGTGNSCGNGVAGVDVKTVGWEPTCECFGRFEKRTGTRLGYGSYHAHEEAGVAYGLRQGGDGPVANPGPPTKELKASWLEYVSDLPLDQHPVVPCTVLDPFVGSGTTVAVATGFGRRGWGIDLSEVYLSQNAIPRIEGSLLSRPGTRHLIKRQTAAITVGRAVK